VVGRMGRKIPATPKTTQSVPPAMRTDLVKGVIIFFSDVPVE